MFENEGVPMKKVVLCLLLASAALLPAQGAELAKSYSYFTIGGTTLEEIEQELRKRGPQVTSTGARHPGATRMEFATRIGYGERNGRCSVVSAKVSVKAQMILPRWSRRSRSDSDTRFVWDTLSADIKRHEESHVVIAKNHAREMEQALMTITNQTSCAIAQEKAQAMTARILDDHDRAQDQFDRVEGINFESRLLRLMRYKMEREAGRP
jgi:predicted secreted Zn-dependent protease